MHIPAETSILVIRHAVANGNLSTVTEKSQKSGNPDSMSERKVITKPIAGGLTRGNVFSRYGLFLKLFFFSGCFDVREPSPSQ